MSVIFDGTNTKYATLPNFGYLHRTKDCGLVVWFKGATGSTQQFLAGMDQNAGGSTRYTGICYRGNSSGQISVVRASTETHHALGSPIADEWNVAVFTRANSGTAIASPSALNSTDVSPSTLINQDFELLRFIIGARRVAGGSTYTDLANVKIGGFALYNTVLTTAQINSYQAGAHPDDVPDGLVDYLIINGTGTATTMLTDAGTTMTFVGSPSLDTDTPFPTQTITDINSGDPVSGDTSGNTFTTTGFTEDITDVTVGGLECTDVSETGGDGTFTVPPPVHLEVYPEIGVNQDVVISGATESATLAKSFVLTGWTVTSLVDPEIVNLQYPTANFDVTPLTDDLMITNTAEVISTTANGGIEVAAAIYTIIMHWKRSTGVMYIYGFTISAEGAVVNRGLTAVGLTAAGLTAVGITARGLAMGAEIIGGIPYNIPFTIGF
jgi:hypothetical protein